MKHMQQRPDDTHERMCDLISWACFTKLEEHFVFHATDTGVAPAISILMVLSFTPTIATNLKIKNNNESLSIKITFFFPFKD
jgi:hypothetical protein